MEGRHHPTQRFKKRNGKRICAMILVMTFVLTSGVLGLMSAPAYASGEITSSAEGAIASDEDPGSQSSSEAEPSPSPTDSDADPTSDDTSNHSEGPVPDTGSSYDDVNASGLGGSAESEEDTITEPSEPSSVPAAILEDDEEDTTNTPESTLAVTAKITGSDSGISYQATVTVPAGNANKQFYAGGGVTVEKDGTEILIPFNIEDMTVSAVTITPTGGETVTLNQYEGGSTENTYLFALNGISTNDYSVDMRFNTASSVLESSCWIFSEESELKVNLMISMDATDASGKKTISDYLLDGYTIKNHFFASLEGYEPASDTNTYSVFVNKSSDLENFVTAVKIYNAQDELQYSSDSADTSASESLYVSQYYSYELYFAERSSLGDYWEMEPDAEGYMTYAIPAEIHPLGDHTTPEQITLSDGTAVAEFYIENQQIKLRFFDVDQYGNATPGTSWLDSPGLKKLSLRFEGAFTGTAATTELVLSEALTVTVQVLDDADLNIRKKAGDYDPATHTVAYTITVSGTGDVHDLALQDTLDNQYAKIVPGSVTASVDGKAETPLACTAGEDCSYTLSGLPDLQKGQVLTISYLVHLDDDAPLYTAAKASTTINNTVCVTGTSPQGKALTKESTAQKGITATTLSKSGSKTTITVDGESQSVIRWTATLGDGYWDVGGLTLADTLGEYLTVYQDQPIEIEAVTRSGKTQTSLISWSDSSVQLPGPDSSFQLTLPASDKDDPYTLFRIRYYTTYETQDSFNIYHNTVNTTWHGYFLSATGSCYMAPVGNVTIEKVGQRDEDSLLFNINIQIPAGLAGTKDFYVTEYCDGVAIFDDGCSYYKATDLTNAQWTVYATTESGEVITFNRYKYNNITENTYSIAWQNQYTDGTHTKFNCSRAILFNCTGVQSQDSTWLINEASTLTIQLRIPLTNKISNDDGYTLEEVLDGGGFMNNTARVYVAGSLSGTSVGRINGVPLHKSGVQGENRTIDYTVILRNEDHVTNGQVMNAAALRNMVFTDTFDPRLEYVPGSLKLEVKTYQTSSSPGSVVDTFSYAGTVSGNSLSVTAADFIDASGRTLSSCAAWACGNNFFFTYQLRVKEQYNDITATSMDFDNTASLNWGSGDSQTLTASTTVTYKTGLLRKGLVNAPEDGDLLGNGNVLKYQIELNPRENDLDSTSDTLTVLDTLPDCLNVIWDTADTVNVVGEYWDSAANAWCTLPDDDWQKSYYYDKSLGAHVLKFQIPDQCHVRITYSCQVTEYGDNVEIVNQVTILGQTTVQDSVESIFQVHAKSGSASSDIQQFAIIKTDSTSHASMQGVKFVLYSAENHTDRTPPVGVDGSISDSNGNTYYYYGEYETNSNGYCLIQGLSKNGKYILRELEAPLGYQKMADRYLYYTEDPLAAEDVPSGFENVFQNQTLSIVNDPIVLPDTGGYGTGLLYMAASILIMLAAGALLHRRQW
jgi:fimbrial isopeptide formation D2 family protein